MDRTLSKTAPRLAVLALTCVSLAACSTVQRLNPFGRDTGPRAQAAAGERIPVLTAENALTPNPALANATFFLPAPQPVTAWPQPGSVPSLAVENIQAAQALEVAWRRDAGAGSSRTTQVTAPLVAADGRIFVLDGEATVSAFDAATGDRVWSRSLRPEGRDRDGFGGGLTVFGGKVFAVSGYRVAAALDAATGAPAWTTELESPVHGAPTVANNRLYAVDVDNQIIALDINSGQQAWSDQAIAEPARILRASSPAVSGETVVAPFSSGELIAFRAANGQQLWQQVLSRSSRTNALSEIRDIAGRPVISRNTVYAASHSGVMAAVDLRTGARRWELPIASVNAPWPAGDVVYVMSLNGELVAANRENGQVYWVRNLNEGRVRQEGGFLGAFDRTVRPQWSGPILASNRLLLVNSDGELVALDARTGVEQRSIRIGGPSFVAPIAVGEMVYVLTDEGQLVAVR